MTFLLKMADTENYQIFRLIHSTIVFAESFLRARPVLPTYCILQFSKFHISLSHIGLRNSEYGLHSLRAGGASASANAGTNDRLIKKEGLWVTNKAMYHVKDYMKALLFVSPNLA